MPIDTALSPFAPVRVELLPERVGLHPLLTAVCDPDCRTLDISAPWLEAGTVYGTDGAMIVTQPARGLDPDLRAALASMRNGRRPRDLAGVILSLQPTMKTPVTPPAVPDADTDRVRRSGQTVAVGGWLLDSGYVAALRKYGAVVYPPVRPSTLTSGRPVFPFRFTAGPVTGWVLVAGIVAPVRGEG